MKKGFITIAVGIGLVSAMIGAVLIYNYIPIGWFKYLDFSQPLIGTTVTDISTATRFADFPAIYNANNLALNNGKIEVSTTTLPLITTLAGLTTVGTITSGTWNASTLTVGYGGTGSTTLSAYHVLLGNGTGNIGVVSGLGTSGMSLVSGGAGAAPTWQSVGVNQTDNYNWTGLHSFAATTTMATTTILGVTGGLMPAGSITAYASSTPPTGWLSANGAAVSRTTYATLFSVIGTAYGVGDGSTTFNVPNLLGRNILMASTTANMAQSGGESNHTQTIAQMPSHNHSGAYGAGAATGSGPDAYGGTWNNSNTTNVPSQGGGQSFNVLDPYLTAWYIIKY